MIGPLFTREALTAPRRNHLFVVRAVVVATLLGLTLTAWQVLVGLGTLEGVGDLARFGAAVLRLLAPLVLLTSLLFSGLLSAAAVSQEKSRGTLLLLLLTDLTNSELVLGRLLASLLTVLVAIAAAAPFYALLTLLGGIDPRQVVGALAVTAAAALAAGSLGSTLALWREKTFQALALTTLGLVLWLALGEAVAQGALGRPLGIDHTAAAAAVSPIHAIAAATAPPIGPPPALAPGAPRAVAGLVAPSWWFVALSCAGAALINGVAVALVRVWNPSREARPVLPLGEAGGAPAADADASPVEGAVGAFPEGGVLVGAARGQDASVHRVAGKARAVWDNPVLWREVRTWAYGRRVLVVKAAYVVLFVLAAAAVVRAAEADASRGVRGGVPAAAAPAAPLLVASLVLINALSVTSLTGERDGRSLDLLLATDLTPRELIFGKLGGVLWNAREMVLLPILLLGWMVGRGLLSWWGFTRCLAPLLVLDAFAAVLGIHAAMIYSSSRRAIATSVGTLLFLFLGVSTCMRMMIALSDSFENQLASFLGFIAGGGVALFAALAWRNPSPAMGLATIAAPAATFYSITSFLLGDYSLVAIASSLAFGFATAAMLVPALSEFDVAIGGGPSRE